MIKTKVIAEREFVFVEVPEETVAWEMYDKESTPLAVMAFVKDPKNLFKPGIPQPIYPIPEGKYQIIGKASELSEEDWKGVVEPVLHVFTNEVLCYEDYKDVLFGGKPTATESGLSLLQSLNLKPETTLILEKLSK